MLEQSDVLGKKKKKKKPQQKTKQTKKKPNYANPHTLDQK